MTSLSFNFISYKDFVKKAGEVAARMALIKTYQNTNNIKQTARFWKCSPNTVRKIIKIYNPNDENSLRYKSRKPKNSPNKIPYTLESKIIKLRKKTGYGRIRIQRLLLAEGINIGLKAIQNVIKRNKLSGKYKRNKYRVRRRFYDFDKLYPFSVFQVDLKEIFDRSTLSEKVILDSEKKKIPPYQWTAIDIKTRLRFLAFSSKKTFNCGLTFILLLIYYLRSHGYKNHITIQTDNGTEFAGISVDKLNFLNKWVFKPLNATLLHIPKGKKEYNSFVERSHLTDDNEFYIPYLHLSKNRKHFFNLALRWQYFYNTKRFHSSLNTTPFNFLLKFYPHIHKSISIFPFLCLDKLSSHPEFFFDFSHHFNYYKNTSRVQYLRVHDLC